MITKLSFQLGRWSQVFCQRRVLGVDIGSDSIKLAEGIVKDHKIALSQIHIEQLDCAEADSVPAEQIAACLAHAVQVGGIQASRAIASLPYDKVFCRELLMPIMDYQELSEAVHWELAKFSPFKAGCYSDFVVIAEQENARRILAVAAERSAVDYLVEIFAGAALDLLAVESLPLALGRVIGGQASCMLVDIGRQATAVTIYQSGIPISSNTIMLGGEGFTTLLRNSLNIARSAAEQLKKRPERGWYGDLNKAEQAELQAALFGLKKQLSCEIMRVYEYHRIQNRDSSIDKIFLCGGAALLTGLSAVIEAEIGLPVELLNDKLALECVDSLAETIVLRNMPQTAAAIGMVMRGN